MDSQKPYLLTVRGNPLDEWCTVDPQCINSLPKTILAGYARYKVRPYIPTPLRCFNCQRFGHSKNACRGKQTCSRCASFGHSSTECNADPKCARKLVYPQPSNTSASLPYSRVVKNTISGCTQTDEKLTRVVCPPLTKLQPFTTNKSQPDTNPCTPVIAQNLPSQTSKNLKKKEKSKYETINSKSADKMDETSSELETISTDKSNQNTDTEIESDNTIQYNPHETIDETPPAPEPSTDFTSVEKTVFTQVPQKSNSAFRLSVIDAHSERTAPVGAEAELLFLNEQRLLAPFICDIFYPEARIKENWFLKRSRDSINRRNARQLNQIHTKGFKSL
ncbi:uncharacterized protein LOC129962848 [Argiope bruennichi]|uniref:uncharacterized protein LOC129962848 n=1 Tax=Argiope bruennichi TaxID=94029 RepID=UPI002494EF95|nr:uncharacterized protein LOC129962848 [Argiope bruennichi]